MAAAPDPTCDWVVVGSGAGGGTVAARLAEEGQQVVLLEAGGDPRADDAGRPRDDYDVPAFHPFASENEAMAWNFFVEHHADAAQARRDPKRGPAGVLYPRAGALGGCTAHNAMILIRPPDSDWEAIAALTGDPDWGAAAMRRRFRRMEECRHRPDRRWLARLGLDRSGHGWRGWLPTEIALPREAFEDEAIVALLLSAAGGLADERGVVDALRRLLERRADPNADDSTGAEGPGLCYAPLSTRDHRRSGARERVLDVAARFPDRLRVELHALATRVLFDDSNRAVGVAWLKGERLYRADPNPAAGAGEAREIRSRRGVVLAGGAFNTPQLLMLSGVGPADELRAVGIAPRVDLPGVGRNLQDRYEIGVVSRMTRPWRALAGARFAPGDPPYQRWKDDGEGMYGSNGAAVATLSRSSRATHAPDLFCMALVVRFEGYFPGYSRWIREHDDRLTWCVLKAHTRNRAGRVSLRSADPRDRPRIDFNFFDPGDDPAGDDVAAVVEGIRHVRRLSEPLRRRGLIAEETLPGPAVESDADLARFVRDNAWGHHASCSAAIGPREAGGALGADLAVHGTRGLHVADASIFPRIPGCFIVSAVYLAAEKAADVLLGRRS